MTHSELRALFVEGQPAVQPRPYGLQRHGTRNARPRRQEGSKRYRIRKVPSFEYDAQKSVNNRSKHGIDFEEAQALWGDPRMLEVKARTTGEPRYLIVGRIAERHWSAIITYRRERVRIISVRRARPEEVALYEGEDLG
jgi:uncharacterized protein